MLQLEDLSHTYPVPGAACASGRTVLNLPAWQVAPGEQVLLRGISGAGKTTLFNILAGLLHPTTGRVCLAGQDLYALSEQARDRFRAKRIGYVFQNHYLLAGFSALENVIMPMAFAGQTPARARQQQATDLLIQLGLADFLHYHPPQLSTGQRLRVAIARALANAPQLLLADEPTAALDFEAAQQVMDFLQQRCREQGAILLVASHDPALSDRFPMTIHLQAGRFHPQEVAT